MPPDIAVMPYFLPRNATQAAFIVSSVMPPRDAVFETYPVDLCIHDPCSSYLMQQLPVVGYPDNECVYDGMTP